MLRQLSADDPRFKTVVFSEGLNLIVAEKTNSSADTDSRNGVGKSSFVELLHFLLGGKPDRNDLTGRLPLRDWTFSLEMDWPNLNEPLHVSRSGAAPAKIWLDPDLIGADEAHIFDLPGCSTPGEWQSLIERKLFGLEGDHPGVSGRALLSFLMRRASGHGFNEAVRTFARQPEAQATPNIAYFLGLDSALAARYQGLAAKKAVNDQFRKAVNDPVLGRVIGKSADLRGEIAVQRAKISEIRRQIDQFRVVPEYEAVKDRADELARRIQDLAQQDAVDRHNLDYLEKAVTEAVDPEVKYLEGVYRDLGVILGDQVRRRFDEVKAFHAAVVRNRRVHLGDEVTTTKSRLEERRSARGRLDTELSEHLRQLSEGGALEALTTLQMALGREEAALGALAHRFEAAQAVEAGTRELAAERVELEREVANDIQDRRFQVDQATLLFNSLVGRLYADRHAYLAIDAGATSLKIDPKISGDRSQGITRMEILCFDLTLAVIAYREGRGPDFLVHDSHIFDGVDGRQMKSALDLAVAITREEGLQYVITINEDDLEKALDEGFTAANHIISPKLTDVYEDGGLFGLRFD